MNELAQRTSEVLSRDLDASVPAGLAMLVAGPTGWMPQTACQTTRSDRDIAEAISPHLPVLRRFARKLTRDPVDADDLVQDCLERAIRQWDQLRTPSAPGSWLNAILYNAWVSGRRRAARRGDQSHGDLDQLMPSSPAEQEQGLFTKDILHAVDRLPPTQRDALTKVAIESLSYRDAASALGVPIGTIMSRLSRARTDLRGRLLA